jgi:hypothetical protein
LTQAPGEKQNAAPLTLNPSSRPSGRLKHTPTRPLRESSCMMY